MDTRIALREAIEADGRAREIDRWHCTGTRSSVIYDILIPHNTGVHSCFEHHEMDEEDLSKVQLGPGHLIPLQSLESTKRHAEANGRCSRA